MLTGRRNDEIYWMFNILSFLALLFIPGSGYAQSVEEAKKTDLIRKHVLTRTNAYVAPTLISRRDATKREVTVSLDVKLEKVIVERPEVKAGKVVIKKDKLLVRTYNGSMIAPLIRAVADDRLIIKLNNRIPKTTADRPPESNKPNGFNITNLHTHGLHVSPEGRSDNVYLEIGPGQNIELCIDIPFDHIAGTFWIHAHRHGSTALQLSSGMAGALIVDPGTKGGLDQVPEIAAAMKEGREKVLVFQQLLYSLKRDGLGQVTEQDVYGGTATNRLTLINGQYAPLIEMRPCEVQRWRCIHAGIDSTLNLAVGTDPGSGQPDLKDPWDLHELAADGIPRYRMASNKNILLQPGYRSDFLLRAPAQLGDYILTSAPVSAAKALRRTAQPPITLARVRVVGIPNPMRLPDPSVTAKYAPRPIKDNELFNRIPYVLVFKADSPAFTINGQEFDRDRVDLCPRLGTAEEWTLKSELDTHPFHIHVNPFEVIKKDAAGKIVSRVWKDTIIFDKDDPEPTYIRSRFEDFPGKTVLHCHNLVHEDQGMMMAIRFVGKATRKSRCVPKVRGGLGQLPAKAPPWSLADAENRIHGGGPIAGKARLLVFYWGLGCIHCRRQLISLASHREALADAKIKVVAIGPDSPEELKKALAIKGVADSIPFLLLADPSLEAFRKYGCFDGTVLHGVFLIDDRGVVHWQYVGDEPFMDVDDLLNRCRALSQKRRP
jgi:FtsP/CotA-like multicopper oxidase with cupredoxin domain/peroxiredoxin